MAFLSITDPSDWPSKMPSLKTIDTLLRCGICYEYFDIAMIIPKCSHNYCSMCIRRYMNYKSQCPTCNHPAEASQLCNNRALDELVSNFKAVRPYILKLCKEDAKKNDTVDIGLFSPPREQSREKKDDKKTKKSPGYFKLSNHDSDGDFVPDHQTEECGSETPRRKGQRRTNYKNTREKIASHVSASPERPNPTSDQDPRPAASSSTTTIPPCSTSSSASSATLNQSNEENIDPTYQPPAGYTGDSDDEVLMATPSKPSLPSTSRLHGESASSAKKSATPVTRSEKVGCPVCGVPISSKHINTHLDSCLTNIEDKEARKRVPKRKPLPKIVSSVLSDKELRKKLKEHGLNTQGNRSVLNKRLQDFTLMYNAQCDSSNPLPVEAIVKEFTKIEKLKSQPNPTLADQRLKVSRSLSEVEIAKSQQEYLKSHSSHFEDLIRNTKQRMNTKSKKASTTDEDLDQKLSSVATTDSSSSNDSGDNRSSVPIEPVNGETLSIQSDVAAIANDGSSDNAEVNSTGVLPGSETEMSDSDAASRKLGAKSVRMNFANVIAKVSKGIISSVSESDNDICSDSEVVVADVAMATGVEVNSEEQMDVTEDELSPVFGRFSGGSTDRGKAGPGPFPENEEQKGTNAKMESETAEDLLNTENSVKDVKNSSVLSPPNLLLLNDVDSISEASSLATVESFSEASGSHGGVPSPPDVRCVPESPQEPAENTRPKRLGRRKRKPEDTTEGDWDGEGGTRVTRSRKRGKTAAD